MNFLAKTLSMIMILLLPFAGSTPAKNKKSDVVVVSSDKFTGVTSVELKKQILVIFPKNAGVMGVTLVSMISAGTADHAIVVTTHTARWQFLGGVDGIVLVDGRRIPVHFQEATSWVGDNSQIGFWAGIAFSSANGYVCNEALKGSISKQDLDAIANGADVEMEIGAAQFRILSKGLDWFKEFDTAVTGLVPTSPVQ